MSTTAELQQQLTEYKPQVRQLRQALAAVHAKTPGTLAAPLWNAVTVLEANEYVRWSARAGRYMMTDKGKTFYKSMRRFG